MDLKTLLYGKSYHLFAIYDLALRFFENSDFISNELFYKGTPPPDQDAVFSFLRDEGLVSIERYGIRITEKGKAKLARGGFKRQLLKERVTFLGIIVGLVGGVLGIIAFICRS
jgi:hypothetical protein